LKLRRFLNLYFVLNTIIVIVQIKTGSFMLQKFLAVNHNRFDHFSGFVGLNGVSVLNFIWIATLLFNLYYYVEKNKTSTLFLVISQFIIMTVIHTFNDMKMFYMTSALFLFVFLTISLNRVKIFKTRYKQKSGLMFFITLYTLPIIAVVAYYSFDLSDEFQKSFDLVSEFFLNGSDVPSIYNERAYLNFEAFHLFNGFGTGIGLANVDIAHQTIHTHLTIHSSSLTIIQGGVIYLLAVVNFYSVLVLQLFSEMGNFKKIKTYLITFFSFLGCAYATEVFRDHYIFLTIAIIFFSMFLSDKSNEYRMKTQQVDTNPKMTKDIIKIVS
ncbi:hypothetical protein, partial [Neobacillus vireti]|uniref:hypothetical protein n=1 Tax=Neobacillus vireti TaxID=220686 RepID=UPI002FFFA860